MNLEKLKQDREDAKDNLARIDRSLKELKLERDKAYRHYLNLDNEYCRLLVDRQKPAYDDGED